MGEREQQALQLSFNRFLRVGFQGSRVTSNGGLILVRELDERLGFGELVEQHLTDPRATNARFSVVRFYNKRGTAEQWIQEGKQAVKMTRAVTIKKSPPKTPGYAEVPGKSGPSRGDNGFEEI